ncbi:MAG: sigma-70 family RNA polymerase sigma factor [bacterium]
MNLQEITSQNDINIWLKEYKAAEDKKTKLQIRDLIVSYYLPFVKKVSHGLARRNTDPIEDLIQVGSLGLLKAIEQYDANAGASFKTYSTYLITGEIRHYLRDKSTMIRAPRELHELSFRINQIIQQLSLKYGRPPTDMEIAEQVQLPINRINEVIEIDRRKQLVSLDQVISGNIENEQTLVDKLIDNKYQDFLTAQEDRIMLAEAVNNLSQGLKEVIELSYFNDLSQNEIAKQLGISQMQVSRRLKKALSELLKIITTKKESTKK